MKKIRSFSPEKINKGIIFVSFLSQKDRDHQSLTTASRMSEDAFGKVWNNPEDDEYDRL